MKTTKAIVLIFLIGLLAGCATYRDTMTDLGEENVANAETTRTVARQLLDTWGLNSGAIRATMELVLNPNAIPPAVYTAMDRMDASAKIGDQEWGELPRFERDRRLGEAAAIHIILGYLIVRQIIQSVAPEIIQLAGLL